MYRVQMSTTTIIFLPNRQQATTMEISSMSHALQLHAQILKSNNHHSHHDDLSKLFSFSALSPAGDLAYARLLLRSLPSPSSFHFNTLLRAYSRSPDPLQAIHFFSRTAHPSTRPDRFTFPFLLKACARLGRAREGSQVHALAVKSGVCADRYVCHALIHMYARCGNTRRARKVFDGMSERDVVSWTAMIGGLAGNGEASEAIGLFGEMGRGGVEANAATVVSVLRACAEAGALGAGRRVHAVAEEVGVGSERNVRAALVDMYAKCGCVESARRVFEEACAERGDVFAWTAMISGLASHGMCEEAVELFDRMLELGVEPDERAMTAVLSACRNGGWLSRGYDYLRNMQRKFGVWPTIQHYGCVVDLLARAGRLAEAEDFVRKMPIEPDAVLWRTLIWACKAHNDARRAERLMKHLEGTKVDSGDCGSLVLIGNVYASEGKWREKARTRELMCKRGLVKPPGSSKIEIDGAIHEFIVGDSGHAEAEKIYAKLGEIKERLRGEGYEPKLSEVLLEIDDEEKAFQLSHHSEKLALAYGLIKTGPGSEIRIAKNLRSCEDCHEFMKAISRIYRREIVVRDRIRFHHFSNGNCSCKDYW